jgi:glycosyltransferase involved in cell wall biosynthesis
MKIAFLADPLDTQYAGIHVFCKELLHALDAIESIHDIYVFRAEEKKEFKNLKEVVFPIKKALLIQHRARLFTKFPKYIKQNNFDVVVELAHFGPFGLPEEIKQITFIHDLTPLTHQKFHGILSQKLHKLLLPSILKKSHLVLCNSKQTQADIIEFAPATKDKIEVLPLGISNFYRPQFDAQAILDLKITKPFLLHVGTLEPRKNIPYLIKAFEEVRKKNKDKELQLVLTGKAGWAYDDILELIENSEYKSDIIRTDYVPKELLPILYTHAECLVIPSYHEGFGLPVLEAMACGCPCLLSGKGALREVAADAALYFNIENIETLIDILSEVLFSPSHLLNLKEKALAHSQKFAWHNTAKAILKSIEGLAITV